MLILPYSRHQSARRFWGIGAVLVIIAIAGVFYGVWGPALTNKLMILFWQARCARFFEPADLVIYQERGNATVGEKDSTKVRSGDNEPSLVRPWPVCFKRLSRELGISSSFDQEEAMLFLGTMKTAEGSERIVAITRHTDTEGPTWSNQPTGADVILPATIWKKGSVRCRGQSVENSVPLSVSSGGSTFQLFRGQLDRDDASHITIAYRYNHGLGTIDGWLINDEVPLAFRDGPLAQRQLKTAKESLGVLLHNLESP